MTTDTSIIPQKRENMQNKIENSSDEKPTLVAPIFEDIPEELRALDQWVVWKAIWNEKRQKWDKPPYDTKGNLAESTNPATWTSFKEAQTAYLKGGYGGVGFVLTEKDPFACIDIDKVDLFELPDYANEILALSFAEVSASGKGFHVWTKYKHNNKTHKNKNTKLDIEIYDKGRFIAVTGHQLNDKAIVSSKTINDYIDAYYARPIKPKTENKNTSTGPEIDDSKVLERMFNSKKNSVKIKSFFNGEWGKFFPSQSEADISLCNFLAAYTKGNAEQMDRIFRSSSLYREKWDRDDYRTNTIDSAISWIQSQPASTNAPSKALEYFADEITTEAGEVYAVPEPFRVINGALFKVELKETKDGVKEVQTMVCRQSPTILRSFSNIERSQLYYEISWLDQGRQYTETVPAGDLAVRKKLLDLADMSLAVNELNAKDLINYFDKFITFNDLPREHLVERLGHINNGFIHPLNSNGVKILPSDMGEKQMIGAFEIKGTTDEWIDNVFNQIKDHPKVVLMILASFASVIMKDLGQKPFIVDLSGITSKGKTTALRTAASVWGNEHLVSEWNLTPVAAERKASFLNSFPLMLDDTRKADERLLKNFVYNFSGGRSKGRGSVLGFQREFTWTNILLSTGEDSLNEYAERAGGVAARILPLTGIPFEDEDYTFFNELYVAIDKYYGTVGLEFLTLWKDKKDILIPQYEPFNDTFQKKAKGNEVVSRLARSYAALVFTGKVLNDFFQLDINLKALSRMFDEINQENKATDKPMQLMEALLTDLDAKRDSVLDGYARNGYDPKAIYKDGTLYLFPAYLKDFLKTEQSTIRGEWLRRGITTSSLNRGKETDFKSIRFQNKIWRVVPVNPQIIEVLGFDFSNEEDAKYQEFD